MNLIHSFLTKSRGVAFLIGGALAVMAPTATRAEVIYQQTFDTDTSDLLADYGFNLWKSNSNAVGNPRVESGVGVWTGGTSGPVGYDFKMWHNVAAELNYDWSQPLTYSVDIGSQSGGGGQSYGILLSSSTSQPTSGGLSYNFYWPSGSGGSFLGDGNVNNRVGNNADPDVAAGTTLYTVALTVRQNAGDPAKFDYKVTVNGSAQTTVTGSLPSGATQDGDWYIGLSKAMYGIAGTDPFNAIGVRADGLGYNSYIDNITLSIADPAYEARILTFGKDIYMATIDDVAGTIAWTVPYSWTLNGLKPDFTLSPGASCVPASGDSNNFETSQDYVVTSGGSSPVQKTYTVTVTKAPASSACDLLGFSFGPSQPEATIGSNTVNQVVTSVTDVSLLSNPDITISPQATLTPPVLVDFSLPQVYRITAEDGVTYKDYTVTVVRSNTLLVKKTFGTATNDLLTDYGFSMYETASWTPVPKAQNGVGVWDGGPTGPVGYDFKMLYDVSATLNYDWSRPLTCSVDIGSQSNGGGQSYGILLSSSVSQPTSGGLSYNLYWPSSSMGSFLGDGNAGNRIYNNTTPDVAAGTTLYTVALTIRQNAGDSGKFDYKVTVNGVAQTIATGSLPSGVTQDGDWYVGLSKATYGIAGSDPFNAIGVRADGLGFNSYLDNLTLELAPPPTATTTDLVSSANPALVGADVTLTATVLNADVVAADATGTMTFAIDGSTVDVATVVAGQASYTTNAIAAGSHTVTATYSGNTTYGTSSDSLTQVVNDDPYTIWASNIPGFTDTKPESDPDGDGLTNQQEFAFGKNPMDGKSPNPVTTPLSPAGTFSYTRTANSGLDYSVWTSTDLNTWTEDTGAGQIAAEPVDGVATVTVTLSSNLLTNTKLFVRVRAD